MNIMQIVLSLECGGLEKLVLDLTTMLNRNGFNACICCLDKFGELAIQAKNKKIEVILIKKLPGKDVSLPIRLGYVIRKKKIDIVHTHNMSPLFYGTLGARLAGVPVVINTRHGREKKHRSSLIWNMNDRIVVISEDAKQQMLKWNSMNSQKTKVIFNGIDVNEYSDEEESTNIKKSLGIDSSHLVIGTVARLSPEKDQKILIKAFSQALSKCANARLVIVGDGQLRGQLEGYCRKLGILNNVLFLGFRQNIPQLLSIFDIFVLSSLTEGISLTLLEAMAAKKPIVATHVGGNPEVVVDGLTGLLVPPKDPDKMANAMLKILQNPDLAKRMGAAGRKRVEEKFSLDRMVREYEKLYEECLMRKRV